MTAAREKEREQTHGLNALRERWQQALGRQVSTEALQQAALGKVSGKVTQWLKSQALDANPRVAQQLRVEHGWEKAVETVLGSYLEAVCVDGLDAIADVLGTFDGGHLAVVSAREIPAVAPSADAESTSRPGGLEAKVQGGAYLHSVLSSVFAAESLAEALRMRRGLGFRAIGGDARRHLAGRGLAAAVAGPGTALRSDRARGIVACPSRAK